MYIKKMFIDPYWAFGNNPKEIEAVQLNYKKFNLYLKVVDFL